jgi:transcriptional regulator with XRE-family HTH domain
MRRLEIRLPAPVVNVMPATRGQLTGPNIVIARKLVRMSQEQLAKLIGKPRARVSEWERGLFEPRPGTLARIAEVTEQPIAFFYIDHSDEDGGA